jgi:hypothetical protein
LGAALTTRRPIVATTQKANAADADDAKAAAEPTAETPNAGRRYDPRVMVYVYDTETGDKLPNPVPETWLDGRFPQLSETPSKKAGK